MTTIQFLTEDTTMESRTPRRRFLPRLATLWLAFWLIAAGAFTYRALTHETAATALCRR